MKNLIEELTTFYKALNHQQVIDLIEAGIDKDNFTILQNKYYHVWIPAKSDKPLPMLVAHSDTVFPAIPTKITSNKGKIFCQDKGIGLGADDRNGCWLLSQMMKLRPDDFIFALFDLEEGGCVGSLSFDIDAVKDKISVLIGLDRQDKSDLALYGFENEELLSLLETIQGYDICYGTMSDCAILAEASGICCFNISVGYYRQHTSGEYTVLSHLKKAQRLLLDLPKTLWGKQFLSDPFFGMEEEIYDDDHYDLSWPWAPLPKSKKGRW